jgi:hypothetical protein
VAGDLFDTIRPEPQVIAAVQDALRGPLSVALMVGNHDQVSAVDGDHALGPLRAEGAVSLGAVDVVEKPTLVSVRGRLPGAHDVEVALVPFRSGRAAEWLPVVLGDLLGEGVPARPRALVLHLGVSDEETPVWLRESEGSIDVRVLAALCRAHHVEQVYAGDWHRTRGWRTGGQLGTALAHLETGSDSSRLAIEVGSVSIRQVGTLAPAGWDDEGLGGFGGLYLWSGGGNEVRVEIPGPRFVDVAEEELRGASRRLDLARAAGNFLFARWRGAPSRLAAVREVLVGLQERHLVYGYDAEAEDPDADVRAREAAAGAARASTLEDALSSYVASMPLSAEDDVLRPMVLSEARRLLALGGG